MALAELGLRVGSTSRTQVSWQAHSMAPSCTAGRICNSESGPWIRWGLCCQFAREPIRFRSATASSLLRLPPSERAAKLSRLCLANAQSLFEALQFCATHQIGCFRIISTLLPAKTHPEVGYQIAALPDAAQIVATLQACGDYAAANGVRTVFHPDQYVVLNSPRPNVVAKSIEELEYQAEVAEWVGADVINIHGGGAYGDKKVALEELARNIDRLPDRVRARLTLENDDRVFTPTDLLPLCRAHGIPLVYDVHHHRCLSDGLTIDEATDAALATWNREPLVHLSSPREGWSGPQPHRHHDQIDVHDFPECWLTFRGTIEVEAKAKELAIARLRQALGHRFSAHAPSAI